jgi:hypothetical protein
MTCNTVHVDELSNILLCRLKSLGLLHQSRQNDIDHQIRATSAADVLNVDLVDQY